jgi:hypothetical protein
MTATQTFKAQAQRGGLVLIGFSFVFYLGSLAILFSCPGFAQALQLAGFY